MSNVNVARGLEVDSDVLALTQTMLESSVSRRFHKQNVFWNSAFMRIQPLGEGASSHDFPFFGDSPEDADHHVAGQFITGGTMTQDSVNIGVDDPLIKAIRLPFKDITLSKFNLIEQAGNECVRVVTEKMDKRTAIVGVKAARTSSVSNVHSGGNVVERGSSANLAAAYPVTDTGAQNFADDLSEMALKMDEDDVPEEGRVAFIPPYIRQVLTRSDKLMSRDYVMATHGSVHDRTVGMVEGFQLVITQHLPTSNVTSDLSKYNGDFSADGSTGQPAALCLYNGNERGAIGGVQASGLVSVIYWDENRDVWLVKVRNMVGMGVLEPFCAGEIRIAA